MKAGYIAAPAALVSLALLAVGAHSVTPSSAQVPAPAASSPAGTALTAGGDCAALAHLHIDNTSIATVALQPAKAPVEGARSPSMNGVPGAGPAIGGLPSFCRVTGSISPEAGSDIRFEVWLPADGWTGRFNGANSGGLAGYINYLDLASAVRAGQAAAGSDTGHAGLPGDAGWARGNPQKVRDYGWRAVHLTTVAAKKLIAAYYGRGPDKSYFIGCSNGGRQALMEATRFPEDYDGIVVGAPASQLTGSALSMTNVIQGQLAPGTAIRADQVKFLQGEVLAQCDATDGQKDGLVSDPRLCRFDMSRLACGTGSSAQCFTPPQLRALALITQGRRDARGRVLAHGYILSGSESGQPVASFGWEGMITAKFSGVGVNKEGKTLSEGLLTEMPATPIATDATFDWGRDFARVKAELGGDLDAVPNLRRFYARGGKIIFWHGWSDPALPAMATIDWYQASLRNSGARARSQSRLFMIPGVQHCMGGAGPDAFGQIGAPLPSDNPESSVGAAIQAWVEQGRAPESLAARHGLITMMMNPKAPSKERLICAWPRRAVLTAGQDPDKAASYTCR